MAVNPFACPNCGQIPRPAEPIAAGKPLCCPGCGTSFLARPGTAPGGVYQGPHAAERFASPGDAWWVSPPPQPVAVPADAPVAVYAAPAPRAGHPALVLGLIAGSLLVLTGSGLALTVYLVQKKQTARPETSASASTADTREKNADELEDRARTDPIDRTFFGSDRRGREEEDDPRLDRRPPDQRERDPVERSDPPSRARPEPVARVWLPPTEQKRVNEAIDHGVQYLKARSTRTGTWGEGGHAIGLASLPALTLLECGVPANDPVIQQAAQYVRDGIPNLNQTYDLALAILFLDRLGERADRPLIQTMTLRLIAGQTATGGWTYTCQVLQPDVERDLLLALEQTRPRTSRDLFVPGPEGKELPVFIAPKGQGDSPGRAVPGERTDPGSNSGAVFDPRSEPDKPRGKKPPSGKKPSDKPAVDPLVFDRLPESVKRMPALNPKPEAAFRKPDNTDNSNTQFAVLAMLAASRHQVPTERCLALIARRFRTSQNLGGGWGYHYHPRGQSKGTPAMTGVGLLGLAVGHGLTGRPGTGDRQLTQDSAIQRALRSLSHQIGEPLGSNKQPRAKMAKHRQPVNFYFLWSLERVGVLYNLPTIADKDWYAWGAELLVDHQQRDGSWCNGDYPGSMPIADTSLALLFLKRANLAKDLSSKLEFLETKPGGR
jgi:hypothetical protein